MSYREPTDLELAIVDRHGLGLVPFGPLTRDEADIEADYEQHMQNEWEEHQAQMRAGGRTVCPTCDYRSVKTSSVCTLGYPGHPGAEFSSYEECEREECDYKDLA